MAADRGARSPAAELRGVACSVADLRAVTEVLTRATRGTDTSARVGDDEFGAYLPGATRESAEVVASRIRHRVFSATQGFDASLRLLTVSIGVAIGGVDGDDPRALLQVAVRADRQLRSQRYRAVPGHPA